MNAALILIAVSASPADLKADMQAKYTGFATAFAKKDIKPFEDALAEDYKLIVPKRPPQTRKQVLADFKRQMNLMGKAKWDRKITEFTEKDHKVTVIVSSHFEGAFKTGQDEKEHTFVNDAVSEDLWAKVGAKWMLKQSTLKSLKATVDGKDAGRL